LPAVRTQVALSMFSDFADGEADPDPRHADTLATMLDELVSWGEAFKSVRAPGPPRHTSAQPAGGPIAELSPA
jgi:hypothetical protein